MNKRKGLFTKISPNDYSIIKYIYLNYDPDEILGIELNINIG